VRIAQVAPLYESVPPKLYGGTERVVAYLTAALVEMGHEVTLFASGDSRTEASLEAACPRALRLERIADSFAPLVVLLERVRRRAEEFDVIHWHVDYFAFPLLRALRTPSVTTLHGRLDLPELPALYSAFSDVPVVSISDAQRAPLPAANYVQTIPHGLPDDFLRRGEGRGGYLAFLGRISPEKAPDAAIRIARAAGMKLRIAAKVDPVDEAYFAERIQPLLAAPHVEFLGEIGDAEKAEFLGDAAALVFPIAWPEPFGLVMIEAMACGTPVIAFRNGSVPEVIDHGVTGFVVDGEAEAVEWAGRVAELDRGRIRVQFERRFSATRMAQDYVKLYRRMMRRSSPVLREVARPAAAAV
jgi:glycosyltransferase involved in cell wall biosynthesis